MEQEHECSACVYSPDGHALCDPAIAKFKQSPHPRQKEEENWTTICFEFRDLLFLSPGNYRFRIWCDGKQLGEVPLELVKKEE